MKRPRQIRHWFCLLLAIFAFSILSGCGGGSSSSTSTNAGDTGTVTGSGN